VEIVSAAVVKALRAQGGKKVDLTPENFNKKILGVLAELRVTEAWFRPGAMIGRDESTALGDATISDLTLVPTLRHVSFYGSALTSKAVEGANLPQLRTLDMRKTRVDKTFLGRSYEIPALETLLLSAGARLGAGIARFSRLQWLDATSKTATTAEELESVNALSNLKDLALSVDATPMLSPLKSASLTTLRLTSVNGGGDLTGLEKLTGLERLCLFNIDVLGPAELERIRALKNLKTISICAWRPKALKQLEDEALHIALAKLPVKLVLMNHGPWEARHRPMLTRFREAGIKCKFGHLLMEAPPPNCPG
jgi:hypothetical protein